MPDANKEIFARNLRHYMTTRSKTREDVCRALCIPYTTLAGWETAQRYPRIESIEKLAAYFGVSKSDLIETPRESAEPSPADIAQLKIALFGGDLDVTDSMWDEACAYARVIAARGRGRRCDK